MGFLERGRTKRVQIVSLKKLLNISCRCASCIHSIMFQLIVIIKPCSYLSNVQYFVMNLIHIVTYPEAICAKRVSRPMLQNETAKTRSPGPLSEPVVHLSMIPIRPDGVCSTAGRKVWVHACLFG